MMLNLKFTAMKIAEIEDEKNSPLAMIVTDAKISTLALLIEKGGDMSREKSYEKIDEILGEGKEVEEILFDIAELVQRDGFFSKTIDIQTLREKSQLEKIELMKQLRKK